MWRMFVYAGRDGGTEGRERERPKEGTNERTSVVTRAAAASSRYVFAVIPPFRGPSSRIRAPFHLGVHERGIKFQGEPGNATGNLLMVEKSINLEPEKIY